jgi:hypothetical protein
MAWLEKFKGPKYPSTTAPQDATRTNYTPTFQKPKDILQGRNFATSPEQYEINSKTGQTTGRGGLQDASLEVLDAIEALNIPLTVGKVLGKAAFKKTASNLLKNKASNNLEEIRNIYHNSDRLLTRPEKRILTEFGAGLPQNYERAGNALTQIPVRSDIYNLNMYNPNLLKRQRTENVRDFISDFADDVQIPYPEHLPLERARNIYHTSDDRLNLEEANLLKLHGVGNIDDYPSSFNSLQNASDYTRNRLADNSYARNRLVNRNINDYAIQNIPRNIDNSSRIQTFLNGLSSRIANQPSYNNVLIPRTETLVKPALINKSGLTKEELLEKTLSKNKDVVSKMSENEFKNTVLKPNGDIVNYIPNNSYKLDNLTDLTNEEYIDLFNQNVDKLNEIVAKNNKSGVQYKIKGLQKGSNEHGYLIFETPEQTLKRNLTPSQQQHWDMYHNDYDNYINNHLGLKQEDGKWRFTTGDISLNNSRFNERQHAEDVLKATIYQKLSPEYKLDAGTSNWGIRLKPGQWKGDVEDIANQSYFQQIPGLEMTNTTGTVFADRTPRKGTKAYESINEYLKELNLGRVKPGFNSQTSSSKGAWENFVNSGRAVGYYGDPKTVYGVMKPFGGYISNNPNLDTYAKGGVVSNLRSQLNLKPKEKATSNHVMQLYENLNLGNFNKEVSDYLTSINDEEELLTHLNKFDEGGIQGRPLISQRPPQFMANQVPLYSTDNNTEVAPEMAPSRLPDPTVEMVEPTIAAPIPTAPSAKPVKQPLLNTTSGTHIAAPSAVDKRTLPKTVKPIVESAHKVETKIESTPVKPLQKSTVTNITKSTSKLPSDALQVLEEKSKNPAWASFKGKYSIYSKENSTLYLFDNNHKLVDQIVAGRGMAKGDFPNTADAHKSAKSNKLKATTPAGSYAIWEERKNSPKSGYGNKTYIYGQPNEAGTATALHDAWGKGNDDEEYARRMAILNDPKIKQKLFSYGCINIPTGWLDKNDANINVGDSVFITPEPMQTNLLGKR